jgi:inner membrane protein
MMSLTHAAIASVGVSFALGNTSPLILGLAIIGSQSPDIDTSTSLFGQILFPVSRWIEKRYPHRTLTHSFLATGAIAICAAPLYFFFGWKVWVALWLGHLIAIFSDTCTKQGVQLFYPLPAWCVFGSNPNKRLTTGGVGEYWVLAIAVGLLVLNFQLTMNGGILQATSQVLGLKKEIVKTYNEEAAKHHVYAEIEGVWASDRSNADGKYFILDSDGTEFIVTDGKAIYKTNQQIIVSKVSSVLGEKATTETKTLTFDDENPLAALRRLRVDFPNAAIYVSGAIAIDAPEDLEMGSQDLSAFQTFSSAGATVTMHYHPLEAAIVQLEDQYVTGTVIVKVISPRP